MTNDQHPDFGSERATALSRREAMKRAGEIILCALGLSLAETAPARSAEPAAPSLPASKADGAAGKAFQRYQILPPPYGEITTYAFCGSGCLTSFTWNGRTNQT